MILVIISLMQISLNPKKKKIINYYRILNRLNILVQLVTKVTFLLKKKLLSNLIFVSVIIIIICLLKLGIIFIFFILFFLYP